jgi:hypothetical protein
MWPVGNDAGSVRASGGLNPVPHLASPRQGGVLLKKQERRGMIFTNFLVILNTDVRWKSLRPDQPIAFPW